MVDTVYRDGPPLRGCFIYKDTIHVLYLNVDKNRKICSMFIVLQITSFLTQTLIF